MIYGIDTLPTVNSTRLCVLHTSPVPHFRIYPQSIVPDTYISYVLWLFNLSAFVPVIPRTVYTRCLRQSSPVEKKEKWPKKVYQDPSKKLQKCIPHRHHDCMSLRRNAFCQENDTEVENTVLYLHGTGTVGYVGPANVFPPSFFSSCVWKEEAPSLSP